jgi:peptidoglycan/xylan/chitin deacetylase (PgdA/CDA1 family)/GT2 family glycosyltransferase
MVPDTAKDAMSSTPAPADHPRTSLIICSRNRPQLLTETIESVLQGDEKPAEIIIVDQSDTPHPILARRSLLSGCEIRYLWTQSVGLCRARNIGIAAARYDILAFTDDDVPVAPRWFSALVRVLLKGGPRSAATGQVYPFEERRGYFVPATRVSSAPAVYEGRVPKDVLSAGNMAMYRSAIHEVGDFDERLGAGAQFPSSDDNDFGFRLLEAGYRVIYVPEAAVYHRAWRSNWELVPLWWGYGVGQGAYYAKHLSLRDRYMLWRMLADFRHYTFRIRSFLRHNRRVALSGVIFLLGIVHGALKWLLKGFDEISAEVEKAGSASVELYRRHPPMLPHLELGAFNETSLRALLLRRALLAIGGPLHSPRLVGPLLGRRPWAREWYRFPYSYCYWRGVRRAVPDRDAWRRFTRGTPILMYHAFGLPGEPASSYVLPGRRFSRQMALLKWLGYHALSLEEFLQCYREHRLPPARSVVITMDDGYADNWSVAYPILRRHGLPATVFLVSSALGTANEWDHGSDLDGRPLLSRSSIHEMSRAGIHFGAHSRSHVPLTAIPPRQVQDEVRGSREELERELRVPICAFSYPYGKFDAATPPIVEQAGFLGACCSFSGVNDPATPRYALRRTEIHGTDSLVRFALALRLGKTSILSRSRWPRQSETAPS